MNYDYVRKVSKRFPLAVVLPLEPHDRAIFGTDGRLVMCPTFQIKDGLVRGEELAWPVHDPRPTPEQSLESNLKAMEDYSAKLYESVAKNEMTPVVQVIGLRVEEFPDNQTIWNVSMWVKCLPKGDQ